MLSSMQETGTLRIARYESWWSRDRLRSYQVIVDGHAIGRVRRGRAQSFPLAGGDHRLRLKIDWYDSHEETFALEPGQTVEFWCWHTQAASGPARAFRSRRDSWVVLMRAPAPPPAV